MFRHLFEQSLAFHQHASPESSETSSEATSSLPGPLPWQTVNEAQDATQRRYNHAHAANTSVMHCESPKHSTP
jgi:hypothetical protein